jgi:hypothetical protein
MAVYVPRSISRDSWTASQMMMALADEQLRSPAMQRQFDRAIRNLVLYGPQSFS